MSSIIKLEALKLNESFEGLQKSIIEYSTPKNALLVTLGLSTSYLLYKIFRFYLKKRKYRHIPGPPTQGLLGFFVGNAFEIQNNIKNGKLMHDLFVKWHETYGEVFKFQMFDQIVVITSDKTTIRDALITKNFPKDPVSMDNIAIPTGERFLGKGLVTVSDYDEWKTRRAIFNPGFHRHVLVTFVDHFNQIMDTLSEKLRSKADNKTVVCLLNEINRATLDAIALIAFGMNTDAVTDEDSIINKYLADVFQTCFKTFINPYMKYQPTKQKEVKEFRHKIRYLREIGRNKVIERINLIKKNEPLPDDILSTILSGYKDGNIDIETMTDEFITFFVAGQETTATTLAFCFLEIARRPDIVKKAREEIDRVLGERTEITFQDVNELKYCSAIFKEALRLYPAAPNVSRYTPEEIDINGTKVPKNTPLWLSTYMTGRCEKFFKNAIEFKPERFVKSANSDDSSVDSYTYLPFSLGPRNCIGQNFAQLEGVIVIAKLVQKFDFRLDPTQSLAPEQNLTLRPKDGTRVFVSVRS